MKFIGSELFYVQVLESMGMCHLLVLRDPVTAKKSRILFVNDLMVASISLFFKVDS